MPSLATPPDQQASKLTWALWYAEQGWPVFPCVGKAPATPHGFHDATCDESQIVTWWGKDPTYNIGSPTGVWAWVLDEDPRNHGDATRYALEQQYGPLPDTLLSLSGRRDGGCHRYWLLPPGGVKHKAQLGEGLDVLAQGGYTILPPSVHPDTHQEYCWDVAYGLDEYGPREAPAWLLALVAPQATPPRSPAVAAGEPILEGTREATLLRLAGALRRQGATEEEMRAMLEVANGRCVPPLAPQDLDRLAHSVARYDPAPSPTFIPTFSTGPGNSNGPLPAQPVSRFDPTAGTTIEQLMSMRRLPPKWLIQKLIPNGLTILAAPAKSYKSYFSLSLALATVGVGDWCGSLPVEETGPVVVFALESPLGQIRNRLHQLAPSFVAAEAQHPLIFFTGMQALPSFKNGLRDAVEAVINEHKPRLVIIDPLSYLYRLGRQDDLASATLDLLWPLAEMASQAGVALFCPEHLRKRSRDDVSVVDQLAGSHIKAAVVHALLVLQREGEELTMETTMRDAASQELTFMLHFDDETQVIQWGYRGANIAEGPTRRSGILRQVLALLAKCRYPMRVIDIITELGLPATEKNKGTIRVGLHRAEKDGLIASTRRGEFLWIAQEGP